MHCNQFRENLNLFLDGELDGASGEHIEAHVAQCDACAGLLRKRESLRHSLKALPVTPPEDGFLESVLEETIINTHRTETRFKATAAIGSAIAAGVIAWLVLVLPADLPSNSGDTLESVTIAMNVEKTFRLTFESDSALGAAAVSVELPSGVEVVGYDGRESVSWTTDIKAGVNILKLPIIVRFGEGGPILARLEHDGKHKSFEFAVEVI